MIIELLKFIINPDDREKFIQIDEKIWTKALSQYDAFLGKEIWINPTEPKELIIIAHWRTMEEWKSIPAAILEATEKKFAQEMGTIPYKLVEFKYYQVRKFKNS